MQQIHSGPLHAARSLGSQGVVTRGFRSLRYRLPATLSVLVTLFSPMSRASERVEIGPKDTRDYICNVFEINRDVTVGTNFWTQAARGGKFEAVSSRKVRVASASSETAARELYEFYQATAPHYVGADRGKSLFSYVVQNCVDDPSSTRGVKVEALPLGRYRPLTSAGEFIDFFFALNREPIPDAQLVTLQDRLVRLPLDSFERRDFVQAKATAIRNQAKVTSAGPVVLSSRAMGSYRPYDFEKDQFDLGEVTNVRYEYTLPTGQAGVRMEPVMPRFNLSDPAGLRFYKPKNQDEAKAIEKVRLSGTATMRTYIQPTKAWLDNNVPSINGVIAAIELRDKKDAVLLRSVAR